MDTGLGRLGRRRPMILPEGFVEGVKLSHFPESLTG